MTEPTTSETAYMEAASSTTTSPQSASNHTETPSTLSNNVSAAQSESAPVSPAASAPAQSPIDRLLGVPAGCKVIVHFRATGDAPILKKHKFQLSASSRFIVLIEFLRKHLHYKPTDALFLFVNAAFAPAPDALVYDLFKQFSINNELVVHYATQDAWG